jgi:hypothetical protein
MIPIGWKKSVSLDNKTPVFATCPFRISLRREYDIAFA